MAQGEANKVWMIPNDFGSALQGFAKLLGAPGSDGVFRYEPSPMDSVSTAPQDDSDEVADWFTTQSDPAIAQALANAEAAARVPVSAVESSGAIGSGPFEASAIEAPPTAQG